MKYFAFLLPFLLLTSHLHAEEPLASPALTVGEFKHVYDPSVGEDKKWYINDHCVLQDADGMWHMFGITHEEPLNPMNEIHFAHATAKDLMQSPWKKEPFALSVAKEKPWNEIHLWAPHVVKQDDTYYMFYCAGDKDHTKYKIHLATSKDLKTWKRHPKNPMVVDGFDGRDPMVLRVNDEWVMYYTATRPADKGNHVVACVTSKDLVTWSEPKVVFTHPTVGTFGGPTESPFVVERKGKFYLFVCTNTPYDDTDVYESDSAFAFDIKNKVGKFPAHCAEVIHAPDGKWYATRAGWDRGGFYIAELEWKK